MIGNIQSPFLWGSKGRAMTPEQVERERERAEALLEGVGDTSPVQHWLQGAGRVVNAITGKIQDRRAEASEALGMASADEYIQGNPVLSGLIGGTGGGSVAPVGTGEARIPEGERAAHIRQGLVSRGLPEHVADAFILNFQDESGLDPGINEREPLVPGSRGGFGLYQLTGPRRVAYEQFAAERGVDPSDVNAQLDFLVAELQGPEARAAQSILSAPDTGTAAAAIVNEFLRPAEEHRARRVARYTGGGGMSPAGRPVPITGGGEGVVGALAGAMGNPWVAKKYGPVIEALMGQQMRRGDMQYQQQLRQSDPMYQAQLAQLTAPAPVDPFAGTQVINNQLVGMGDGGPQVLGDFNTPDPTSAQQNYEFLLSQGLSPEEARAAAFSNGVTVNNNMPGQDKFDEAFGGADAAAMSTISEAGLAAQRNIARIDQLASLLGSSPSGFAGAAKLRAGEWGISTEGLSDLQAAQAIINSLVPEQRQPGSGPMSDADLELFKQSLPRIINQPGGNDRIISTMRAIAEYDAEGARIVQGVRAGELTRAQAMEALQNRANPMEGFAAPAAEPASTADPAQNASGFEAFAADPAAQAAAERYGVTIEEMWEVRQGLK